MPQQNQKKKGRKPAHQNTFAFYHNPNSRTTKKILASPNVNVCKRCYDKIEWRKKYRKYKPRKQPGVCNKCHERNVKAAYHTICSGCSYVVKDGNTLRICAMCAKEPVYTRDDKCHDTTSDAIAIAMENSDKPLKLREIRSIQRQAQKQRNKNDSDDDSNYQSGSDDDDTTNDAFLEVIGGQQNFVTSVEEYQNSKLIEEEKMKE